MFLRNPNSKPLLKRLLEPSPKMLFAVAVIAFLGSAYFAQPHARFLIRGSMGTAEIIALEPGSFDYARYRVRLVEPDNPNAVGIIESDRRSMEVGTRIPVFYRRDHPRSMLSIEIFAPWARSVWLLAVGLAALGLAHREKDRLPKEGTEEEGEK